MNDYNYPTPTKELKSVPLYQNDQVPYSSFQQQKKQSEDISTTPMNCDLQDVIFYYQSQPDLLRLILQSKVEEDRRRAEEAKLRAKELDLLMLQQQQTQQQTQQQPLPSQQHTFQQLQSPSSSSFLQQHHGYAPIDDRIIRRPTPDMTTELSRRDSPVASSSFGASSHSEEEVFSPLPTTSTNTPAGPGGISMFPLNSYPVPKPSMSPVLDDNVFVLSSTDVDPTYHTPPPIQRYDPYFSHRPRRRREMQAITKIVETREYPYVDGYFWKNNGNTIQKKTGNKSVYYKCSNSVKGCPVNKTVTWKENGEYLIKYRGEHLPDCNRVQRVVDM